jgi:hypothetical protein
MPKLNHFIELNKEKIPIIAYHGNPYSRGMDDKKARQRMDYNMLAIGYITQLMTSLTGEKGRNSEPKMLCGHLHSSNKPYYWAIGDKKIELYPLGIRDLAFLDTTTGKITVKPY